MKLSVIKNKVGATTKEVHNKDLAKFITTNDYSLITFEDNYRKAKNFKEAEAFGLDFDDGMTIGTAVKAFKDYKHIIAPTQNHRKEKNGRIADRFRVILFFDKPVTSKAVYVDTVKEWMKKFPQADEACKDAARYFFKSTGIESTNDKGKLVTPTELVKLIKAPQDNKVINYKKKPLGFTNCMWSIANGNFGDGERNSALLALTTNLKGLGYSKENAYYFCKDACEKRGKAFDKDEIWEKTIMVVYGDEFGTVKFNCKDKTNFMGKHCSSLGDNACKSSSGFNLKKMSDFWKEEHKLEWFVNDLLIKGGVTLFTGDPKAGKSTIIRQLVKATTIGGYFLGRKVKQGRVLYLALEESEALLKYQLKKVGINGEEDIYIHIGAPRTDDPIEALADAMRELDPVLVVVDTLGHIFGASDFNDYAEVQRNFTGYREAARRSGAHLVFIHHNNKSGDASGSQAFKGAVDNIMQLNRMGDTRKISTDQRGGKRFNRETLEFDADTETYTLGDSNKVKTPGGF